MQTDALLLANNSQHCWMLHVVSVCTPCCMLLDVVACCCTKFETGQTFQTTTPNISFVPWSPKRSATMLDPFAQLFQHCWGRARALRMVYKDLWAVSFPRCTADPNIVGSCCIRLHTTANTHATTPNIVGATMLEVVASVCMQLKQRLQQWKPSRTIAKNTCVLWNLSRLLPAQFVHVGDFSWSLIPKDFIQVQNRGRKIRRRMFTSSANRRIWRFHVIVVQWASKKRDARAELLYYS